MIFQRVNRTNAERVFAVFRANDANLGADDAVQLDTTAASVDGVLVVQPSTNQLNCVIGIADAAISNGAYGLVQVYGYRSTSLQHASGTTVTAGDQLVPIGGSGGLQVVQGGNVCGMADSAIAPSFIALESKASATGTSATGTGKIFIRCM